MLDTDHMPCECLEEDHSSTWFKRFPHWPGERFIVQQALRIVRESLDPPSPEELIRVVAAIVGPLSIAETMYENAINFGTIKLDRDGGVIDGHGIPRGLLQRRDSQGQDMRA